MFDVPIGVEWATDLSVPLQLN